MSIYQLCNKGIDNLPNNFDLSDDPSLNKTMASATKHRYKVSSNVLGEMFLKEYNLDYISEYCSEKEIPLQVLSFPKATKTCYEKAMALQNWNPLNVIKAFYLESQIDGSLYAVIVPETGCFLDRNIVKQKVSMIHEDQLIRSTHLPSNMTFGTCSPFILNDDLCEHGGHVKHIIFDSETLAEKKEENMLDDFSFGLDHKLSLQINYYHCFNMLSQLYPNTVIERDVLRLSFKERFARKKGRIKVDYEFTSLNYRTAKFISDNHGYGDVYIENDQTDELNMPDIFPQDLKTFQFPCTVT